METKKPWQSKTMLLNGIVGLAAFLALFIPWAAGIQPWISANEATIALVWSILQMGLRAVSKDKIQLVD